MDAQQQGPRVLLVGAGAVAQPWAYHLTKGGARVTFFVKAKYADQLRRSPLVLHRLRGGGTWPVHFSDYSVISSLDEVAAGTWDFVIVTLASDALRADGFLANFVRRLQGNPVVVMLSDGYDDRQLYLDAGVPSDRLVLGLIDMIAWQAPIPGERKHPVAPSDTENTAIGYLPGSGQKFAGDRGLLAPLTDAFTKGGLPARAVDDLTAVKLGNMAFFIGFLCVLQTNGWSFDQVRRGSHLSEASSAAWELLPIAAAMAQRPWIGYLRFGVYALVYRLMLFAMVHFFAFDMERYLQYHFTKVSKQMELYANTFIREGRKRGLPTTTFAQLVARNPHWQLADDAGDANDERK